MNKIKAGILAPALLAAGNMMAQGTSTILDTTQLAADATTLKTEITSFFSTSIGPFVMAVAGAAFLVTMAFVLFRWARRAAK